NLRRWINRPGCPPLLQEFHRMFTKYFGVNLNARVTPNKTVPLGTRAHYDYGGSHYSRASTHVGNSLIMYTKSGKTVAGSVEEINIRESGPEFVVRRQAPLPAGKNDPFKVFPDIAATTYSSKMSDQLDAIHPKAIIGHYARFEFSDDRAVVLELNKVSPS
ncbi:hypothetical protein B0H12DRAFT_1018400, partial [Mycena haematopus]